MRPLPLLWLCVFLSLTSFSQAGRVTVEETDDTIVVRLAVELCPDTGVTQQDLRDFVAKHRAGAEEILNRNSRGFRTSREAKPKPVRIEIVFTYLETCDTPFSPDRHRFKVRPGRPPKSERRNASSGQLFLENTTRTVAHELGHALGLDDEYADRGGTRSNLMGRSGSGHDRTVTDEHLMTILFVHLGNPDAVEARCRRTLKALLRLYGRQKAREIFIQNCPEEMFDRLMALLDANGVPLQPPPPK